MSDHLRRKFSFRINGQKQILIKRPEEKETHVFMKIFLAKLYNQTYEDIKIEVRHAAEQRYKPDLLATNLEGDALFWGECGEVSLEKIRYLMSRYRQTHLCFAKWNIKPTLFEQMIDTSLQKLKKSRHAPVDFINFKDEDRKYIDTQGEILIEWNDLYFRRW